MSIPHFSNLCVRIPWQTNLLLAFAYAVSSYAGQLLALPPANASPIWPAAGIALASVYTYGTRVLPGLFLGAFFINTYDIARYRPEEYGARLPFELLITSASVLQAWCGAWLIQRRIGAHDPLVDGKKIFSFLTYGGPVACLIASTIGSTTRLAVDISLTYQTFNYQAWLVAALTWWLGDCVGVLIFAPVTLAFLERKQEIWHKRRLTVALPLFGMSLLLFALFQYGRDLEIQRIAHQFEQQRASFQRNMQDRLIRHQNVVEALKYFFDSIGEPSNEQFLAFVEPLYRKYPASQALEWIPRISHAQREALNLPIYERTLDGVLFPAAVREEYYPILYLHPLDRHDNQRALGFDIGANPTARDTVERARDRQQTAATTVIHLVQDLVPRPAIVFYAPVYQSAQDLPDVAQRRALFRGVTANVVRLDEELAEVYQRLGHPPLQLMISDGDIIIYNNLPATPPNFLHFPVLKTPDTLHLADHLWKVVYQPHPMFYLEQFSWHLWWLLLAGFWFAGLMGGGLLLLTGNHDTVAKLVRQRTRALEQESQQRRRISQERDDHNRILRAVAEQEDLATTLHLIVEVAETANPDMICSILLYDAAQQRLYHGAARSLPDFYLAAVDGVKVGYGVGACGHAVYTNQLTITEDVQTHPYWQPYRTLMQRAGFAACWSLPIRSSSGSILGTFALYHPYPTAPCRNLVDWMQNMAQLASLAIERHQKEQYIQHLAYYDALTSLPNRRMLLDTLDKELAYGLRSGKFGALLFLDLDHFKTLNDSLGHDIGDELLRQIGQRLAACIREEDTLARLGGDEFVILLRCTASDEDTILQEAQALSLRILETLQVPYLLQHHAHHMTTSIGIAAFPKQHISAHEILKQADTAMYSAKHNGRNTYCFYHEDMQKKADARLTLEQDLRRALVEQQFELFYQPQVDLEGRIVGAEALLRWSHPEKGSISPATFIPIAEESSLILELSEWILRTACRDLQAWPTLPHLAINISSRHFRQADFVEQIQRILEETQAQNQRLALEITESCLLEQTEETLHKMQALQQLGIQLSIDDFGTGYSSLAYLKRLPVNQLKIDQSFVRDIASDPNDALITETIILLARKMGLSVIAEGVENAEQLAFLQLHGCRYFQGYYFSRPMSASAFSEWLAQPTLPQDWQHLRFHCADWAASL